MTRACQSFFPFERSDTTRPPCPTWATCCARRTTSFRRRARATCSARSAQRSPCRAARGVRAAAETFTRWQADGTLVRDDRPFIYVYEQRYSTPDGGEAACRGFFCRLRLEPYGPEGGVRPHERTLSAAKGGPLPADEGGPSQPQPRAVPVRRRRAGRGARVDRGADRGTPPAVEAVGPGGLSNRMWLADPAKSTAAKSLLDIAAAQPVTSPTATTATKRRCATATRSAATDAPVTCWR